MFVSPAMIYPGNRRISEQTAVGGADFDQAILDQQLEILVEAAQVLKAEGVWAGHHNHIGSPVETEYEVDYVLGNTDPALLGASLDVRHLSWAGIDYRALLRRHKDRLLDLHLKDIDQGTPDASRATPTSYYEVADQRFFLEPGLGNLDLDGLLADLGESGFGGWVIIEVDRASMEPFESARLSWNWVTEHIPA